MEHGDYFVEPFEHIVLAVRETLDMNNILQFVESFLRDVNDLCVGCGIADYLVFEFFSEFSICIHDFNSRAGADYCIVQCEICVPVFGMILLAVLWNNCYHRKWIFLQEIDDPLFVFLADEYCHYISNCVIELVCSISNGDRDWVW